MSFMRERVAPLECRPPQGRYEGGSLRVYLHTSTPGCSMIFTLDGSAPIESSDRDQGYRCEHYNAKGFDLRGGGKHTLTVVAMKKGLVATKPTTFTFTLDGPPHQRKLHGTERNLHTAFQLASHESGGGRMSPLDVCVLRDISSRADLRSTIEASGGPQHVRVFKLKYRSHEVSRSIAFERVATPSVNMTMPMLPNATPSLSSKSPSLRNTVARCMTPARYESPLAFTPQHGAMMLSTAFTRVGTPVMLDSSRPQSPSATFNGSFQLHDDRSKTILPKIRPDYHPERSTQQSQVNADISMFELKQGMSHIRVDDGAVQESADRAEEDQYHAACEAVVEREIQRKAGLSKIFSRVAKERLPTNVQHTDIAEVDFEPLNVFLTCMQVATSELLRTVITTKPLVSIVKELSGIHQIASADLARSFGTTPEVVQRNLKGIAVKLADGLRYPCKVVIALLRYLVCLAEPIPEAPLYMFLLIWRISAEKKSAANEGGSVGRLSFLTAIDVYRRTRGAHAVAVAQLYDAYYHGLEWAREGTVSVAQLVQHFADHIPHVDAAIAWMGDIEHPMYKRTVSAASL